MGSMVVVAAVGLGTLGGIFGAILAFAARKFAVVIDPRIAKITEVLPAANCGGCGYPGCAGYAEAIVVENESVSLCSPGGNKTAETIAEFLGVAADAVVSQVVVVRCGGARAAAKEKYIYDGLRDCNIAALLNGGPKACDFGCIGLGSCAKSCPYEAIKMLASGLPQVNEAKCTGCGICINVCPKNILQLLPRSQRVYVACSSPSRGKEVKAVCQVGCTGCTLCANPKFTPSAKVTITNNLPVIAPDWEDFGTAVDKCPTRCLVVRDN